MQYNPNKNKKIKKVILILGAILVLLLVIPIPFYNGKKVHISIDDIYECMKTITIDSIKYESIYEHPFFNKLNSIHKKTGAKFTLYTYEKGNEYSINDFPYKYKTELQQSKDWLQFGFHTVSPDISKDSIADFLTFTQSFNIFSNNNYKLGGALLRSGFIFTLQRQRK